MEKFRLEVQRFTSEDIIATSGGWSPTGLVYAGSVHVDEVVKTETYSQFWWNAENYEETSNPFNPLSRPLSDGRNNWRYYDKDGMSQPYYLDGVPVSADSTFETNTWYDLYTESLTNPYSMYFHKSPYQ